MGNVSPTSSRRGSRAAHEPTALRAVPTRAVPTRAIPTRAIPTRATPTRAISIRLTATALLAAFLLAGDAPGQFKIQVGPGGIGAAKDEATPDREHQLAVVNRKLLEKLNRAQEKLKGDDFSAAIEFLQESILDPSEDVFVDQQMAASLKSEALALFAGFTPEQRRQYELRYGATARQELAEAAAPMDMARVAEVARRWFHTDAGREAAYLLGSWHLDQARFPEGAMWLERLRRSPEARRGFEPVLSLKAAVCWLRAGEADRCRETLLEARKASTGPRVTLGGRDVAWFSQGADPAAWLEKELGRSPRGGFGAGLAGWSHPGGNAAHNGVAMPVSPLWLPAWTTSSLLREESPDPAREKLVKAELDRLRRDNRESSFLALPASQPLCLTGVAWPSPIEDESADTPRSDLVVFRTLGNVRAVNLKTGRTVWETFLLDPSYERLIEGEWGGTPQGQPQQLSPLQLLLTQRAWRDATAGTLSSDGRRVYAVEDLGFVGLFPNYVVLRGGVQSPLAPNEHNRLVAYEAATGRLMWETGGPRGDRELPLAGVFFLGPPLPVGDRLYCLAEQSGEIRLYVLNPENGAVDWSQTLVVPESSLDLYTPRRMVGAMPAYSDGVLVCGTEGRGVVAVDVARRQLLWGRSYPSPIVTPRGRNRAIFIANGRQVGPTPDDESRWLDTTPVIAGGFVLVTPRDSEELLCLRLEDGKLLWRRPRGQGLYVAGALDGKVIVVGRNQVEAWRLAETEPRQVPPDAKTDDDHAPQPKPAWRQSIPITMPSGRGVQSGGHYHLPLESGEIVTLDLSSGRLLARSKVSAGSPGNLVAARGTLVSQTVDQVTALESLDAVERRIADSLARSAADAPALALRAQLRMHRGEEAQGLADLRKSVESDPNSPARPILVAALLEGLRHDYAANRHSTDELNRLISTPEERSQFVRLIAAGLHTIGDREAAFAEYLKLAGADGASAPLERFDGGRAVRTDRWVRARIREIFADAPEEQRARMHDALQERIDAVVARGEPAELRSVLHMFGGLPPAAAVRQALAEKLPLARQSLERELLLLRLRQSPDPLIAADATARLASLYQSLDQGPSLEPMLADLEGRFADTPCSEAQAGRAVAASLRADERTARLLAESASAWPDNRIEARRGGRRGNVEKDYLIEMFGPRGSFDGWTLALDARRQTIVARDGSGRTRWSIPVSSLRDPRRPNDPARAVPNVIGNYARAHGHLLVIVLGNFFCVLDTLAPGAAPQVLWVRDLADPNARSPGYIGFNQVRRVGGRRQAVTDGANRPVGMVGLVNDELVCYQVGTTIVAADPLTGDVLWERRDVSRGSEIFGDAEFAIVVPQASQQATVYRAADGDLAATRIVPSEESRLISEGRLIVSSSVVNGQPLLTATDPAAGDRLWQKSLPGGTRWATVKDEDIAVFEPEGWLRVFAAATGRPRIEAQLGKVKDLEELHVLRTRARWLVLTRTTVVQGARIQPYGGYAATLQVNGPAWALDPQGKPLWKTDIPLQTLELSQPEDLPALVFSVLRYGQAPGQPGIQPQWEMLAIDARTGAALYKDGTTQQTMPYQLRVDPTRKSIGVDFNTGSLELTMTDTPLAAPAEAEVPK